MRVKRGLVILTMALLMLAAARPSCKSQCEVMSEVWVQVCLDQGLGTPAQCTQQGHAVYCGCYSSCSGGQPAPECGVAGVR